MSPALSVIRRRARPLTDRIGRARQAGRSLLMSASHRKILTGSAMISGGTLLTRLLGMVREGETASSLPRKIGYFQPRSL